MAEPKLRPFRWMHRGVLHIELPDGKVHVVPPGGFVRKAEHLASLGAARIEEFIKDGIAEAVNIVDGLIEAINPAPAQTPKEELEQAQTIAQDSRDEGKSIKNLRDQQQAKAADKPLSTPPSVGAQAPGAPADGAGPK